MPMVESLSLRLARSLHHPCSTTCLGGQPSLLGIEPCPSPASPGVRVRGSPLVLTAYFQKGLPCVSPMTLDLVGSPIIRPSAFAATTTTTTRVLHGHLCYHLAPHSR